MRKIKASVEVLSQSEIEFVHKSALKILERIGIKVPNDYCLDACERMGAKVDRTTSVVKIPSLLMEEILMEIRKYARVRPEDEGVRELKGNISTQIFMVDYKTQARRYGTMEDIVKGITLVDGLPYISASSAVVVPHDVPANMSDILAYQAIYTYSKKPGGTYVLSPTTAKYIIQMADAMGYGMGYFLETVSPLQFAKESLAMAEVYAKMGRGIGVGPMVVGGSTGPITLAGTVTQQTAEILGSIFVVYTLNSGHGSYSSYNHTMDLRTTLCSFGSPNQALLGIAAAQMGKFYGMGVSCNSALTDALVPDFQAGFEKAATGIFSCLAGVDSVGAQGIVGADQGVSFEQLVIDNEWLSAYNYILRGMEVNEDTVGFETIEEVGIGGNFVSEEHTVEFMRENYWPSKLFNRDYWDNWKEKGAKQLLDRAHEYVESVLSNQYPPEPAIDQARLDAINDIVECAKKEICG